LLCFSFLTYFSFMSAFLSKQIRRENFNLLFSL
jgi:hypothetical protein